MLRWLLQPILFNVIYLSFPLGVSLLVVEANYLSLAVLTNAWTTLLSILATRLFHNELSRSPGLTSGSLQQNLDNIAGQVILCSMLNGISQAVIYWRDIGRDYWLVVWPTTHLICLLLNITCFQLTDEKLRQMFFKRRP